MRSMAQISKQESDTLIDKDNKLVHFFMTSKGYQAINPPQWSKELECPFCGETDFILFMVDKERRAWGCRRVCEGSKMKILSGGTSTLPKEKRAILWPLFCENNGIGDEHYDVKFENIQQSQGKIDYMLKFATAPRGIILMRGDPGTGKTYAAMAMCEFFTRSSSNCVFTTQKQMSNNWLAAQGDHMNNYINTVTTTPLLVVDDFATGEPNPKFLEFFMELINTRLQWKTRGTVITTNLDVKKFSLFCGEALSDRIATGELFNFEGNTRRKKIIL
jgi:hypothetical protein